MRRVGESDRAMPMDCVPTGGVLYRHRKAAKDTEVRETRETRKPGVLFVYFVYFVV